MHLGDMYLLTAPAAGAVYWSVRRIALHAAHASNRRIGGQLKQVTGKMSEPPGARSQKNLLIDKNLV